MADEKDPKGYTIRDRRHQAGEEQPAPKTQPETAPKAEPSAAKSGATPPPRSERLTPEGATTSGGSPAAVDFASFVLSIATNAVMNLGGDSPEGAPSGKVHLGAAAQHIDLLAMLAEKTHGNLTEEEAHLLASLLYDLRMHFFAVSKELGKNPPPKG